MQAHRTELPNESSRHLVLRLAGPEQGSLNRALIVMWLTGTRRSMIEKVGTIRNPLSIIAVFAAIAETVFGEKPLLNPRETVVIATSVPRNRQQLNGTAASLFSLAY